MPYLYAAVPVNFKLSDIAKCIEALNNAARKVVIDIKMEEKQKIYGFENKIDMFFKISVILLHLDRDEFSGELLRVSGLRNAMLLNI